MGTLVVILFIAAVAVSFVSEELAGTVATVALVIWILSAVFGGKKKKGGQAESVPQPSKPAVPAPSPAAPKPSALTCPKCGKEFDPSVFFCDIDGTRLQ